MCAVLWAVFHHNKLVPYVKKKAERAFPFCHSSVHFLSEFHTSAILRGAYFIKGGPGVNHLLETYVV